MREIKFRCWTGRMSRGYGLKELIDDSCFDSGVVYLQFTGLLDKNGVEIYEGDVVKYRYSRDTTGKDIVEFTEVVEWSNTTDLIGFGVHQLMGHEVIGNIYENAELLTVCE